MGRRMGEGGFEETYSRISSRRSKQRSLMSVAKLSVVRARAQMWVMRLSMCHLFS